MIRAEIRGAEEDMRMGGGRRPEKEPLYHRHGTDLK